MNIEELKKAIENYIEKNSNDQIISRMPITLPTLNDGAFIIHHVYGVKVDDVSEIEQAKGLWGFTGSASLRISEKKKTVDSQIVNVDITGRAYIKKFENPEPELQNFDVVKVVITKPTNITI